MDTISRNEIEYAATVVGKQFCGNTSYVIDVHSKHIQESRPLRIYECYIQGFALLIAPRSLHQPLPHPF